MPLKIWVGRLSRAPAFSTSANTLMFLTLLTFIKLLSPVIQLADCSIEAASHSSSDISTESVKILPTSGIKPLGTSLSGLVRNMRPPILPTSGDRFGAPVSAGGFSGFPTLSQWHLAPEP
jgi:hypothetical protein